MEGKLQKYWPLSLRILLGIGFLVHGAPKLFSAAGHAGFVAMLQQIGIPASGFFAWVVGIVEFFGGIALVIGFFTAEATVLLAINMLVAMFKVHLAQGFSFIQIIGKTPEGMPQFGMPGAEVNRVRMKGYALLFARRIFWRPIRTYKLLRLFGKHMKRSDIFKLLWSPFRRRTLNRSPELPASMIDSVIEKPERGAVSIT